LDKSLKKGSGRRAGTYPLSNKVREWEKARHSRSLIKKGSERRADTQSQSRIVFVIGVYSTKDGTGRRADTQPQSYYRVCNVVCDGGIFHKRLKRVLEKGIDGRRKVTSDCEGSEACFVQPWTCQSHLSFLLCSRYLRRFIHQSQPQSKDRMYDGVLSTRD